MPPEKKASPALEGAWGRLFHGTRQKQQQYQPQTNKDKDKKRKLKNGEELVMRTDQARKKAALKDDEMRRIRLGDNAEKIKFAVLQHQGKKSKNNNKNKSGWMDAPRLVLAPNKKQAEIPSIKGLISMDVKEMIAKEENTRDGNVTRLGKRLAAMQEDDRNRVFSSGFYQTAYGMYRVDDMGGIHKHVEN